MPAAMAAGGIFARALFHATFAAFKALSDYADGMCLNGTGLSDGDVASIHAVTVEQEGGLGGFRGGHGDKGAAIGKAGGRVQQHFDFCDRSLLRKQSQHNTFRAVRREDSRRIICYSYLPKKCQTLNKCVNVSGLGQEDGLLPGERQTVFPLSLGASLQAEYSN